MKVKRIKKTAAFLLAVVMAFPVSAYADSSPAYFMAPHVTEEMCSVDFWLNKTDSPDKVIMTEQEIADFNRSVLDTEETYTIDLAALPEKFDGRSMADSLAAFESPNGFYIDGEAASEEYYEKIRENIKNADVSSDMSISYGFAVNRTLMKAYPYKEFLSDSPSDPEWDELVSTEIQLNEPLVIYFATADDQFSLVKNECCSGWVPTEDIAVCSDRAEWLDASSPKKFIVVTGEKIYLEASADEDISEKMMAMGTKLELVDSYPGMVAEVSNKDNCYYMNLKYYLIDTYEFPVHWTKEDEASDMDNDAHDLHEQGLAREYKIIGEYNQTISWKKGTLIKPKPSVTVRSDEYNKKPIS